MTSGLGPAGWTERGSPVPGLAVSRPSRAGTVARGGPDQPFRAATPAVIRGYSTPSHISCYHVTERSPPQQSGTGPTSWWYQLALACRVLLLEAVRRLASARRERAQERPVTPIGRGEGVVERDRNGAVPATVRTPTQQSGTGPAAS